MLYRSILAKTQHAFARRANASAFTVARQTRLYTEKDGLPNIGKPTQSSAETKDAQTNATNNNETAEAQQQPQEPSLSSLISTMNASRKETKAEAAAKRQQALKELLGSGDSPLKGDAFGFRGAGLYGGQVSERTNREAKNPMSKLVLHVHASSNNTILSLTDANGRVIVNASGGSVGFKKAQRAGFEAAYQATASVINTVIERDIQVPKIELRLKGFGAGRDASFKAITGLTNWSVCRIVDTTPIPFNGCRPKKARRL
ncbi:hypothetical protein IW140_004597 [Coemansia sp. RSA 1813]|nr:hypothetical protein EV178_002170 [Coemansia sp. RSA 1646]KAJ1766042.1 hypothetical protein LPJ74_006080 [Coemansia sp. RSA 1843]KAJ2090330.1 hypothetical protein IW138_002756 [Coemansia sp. RSA 986]KAJ2215520.1 hypothetical protein EV179_002113 [Coemansia sp. RSA 487]KAJ2567172.1 hypothetical protein IW140_004597 [Coemansia sp. RSA 1813]